jgi:integrase
VSRRAPHEGSIYQRKDGRWEAVLHLGYVGGKRRKKSFYGRTQKVVRNKLLVAQRNLQQGILPAGETETVGQFLARWLEIEARPRLRPSTFQSYAGIVRIHIIPGLGRLRLAAIGPQHVQEFLADWSKGPLSTRRVQYIHAVLRAALGDAVRWELIARNPAALVRPPRVIRVEAEAFDEVQARQLLSAAHDDRLRALYTLAVAIGIRQGEALGLRWNDVDLDAGRITIKHTLQRIGGRLALVEPKTAKSRRTVDIPRSVVSDLRSRRAAQHMERLLAGAGWHEGNFVFTTRSGTPIDSATVTRAFHRLVASADLPRRTFHSLRHTCASLLTAAGVHPRVIMEILGHSQIALTMNTYAHVFTEGKSDAASRMEAILNPSVQDLAKSS